MKRLQNSYTLENLDGSSINGTSSSRRLWEFIPRKGINLVAEQQELEEKLVKEDSDNECVSKDREGEGEDTGVEDCCSKAAANTQIQHSDSRIRK